MKKPRATKASKARDARINSAYGRVGSGRPIPLMSIPVIFAAGERALEACAKFHLPLSEAEVENALENALDSAIAAVEISR